MNKKSLLATMAVFCLLFAGVAFADSEMISGNVTALNKESGAIEVHTVQGDNKKFTVTDKDILAGQVWKKRLQVGDGVDIKADGDKVLTVLRRNLPATIRSNEAKAGSAAAKPAH